MQRQVVTGRNLFSRATMCWLMLLLPATLFGASAKAPPPSNAAEQPSSAPFSDPTMGHADSILLARQLAKYGRTHRMPEALIVAAHILATTPTRTKQLEMEETASPEAAKPAKEGAAQRPIDVATLVSEAKAMEPKNKTIQAMADKVPTARGNVDGGSIVISMDLKPMTERSTNIEFLGGEEAFIGVSGNGSSDIDCWIYDTEGRTVMSVTDPRDECRMIWVPKATEKFRLRLKNKGPVANHFVILTN